VKNVSNAFSFETFAFMLSLFLLFLLKNVKHLLSLQTIIPTRRSNTDHHAKALTFSSVGTGGSLQHGARAPHRIRASCERNHANAPFFAARRPRGHHLAVQRY
jgi:ABC-type nickel/cobalt efflux system permease component RcnA